MPATIILGGQWGDEAKGKITDTLAAQADMVIRPNGSTNAGHTVVTEEGVFKFHLVPSGILYPHCTCVIGAGVAVSPPDLIREIEALQQRQLDLGRLFLSDRAHVVMPYHPLLDQYEEERLGPASIGTTRRGNGPAFTDKIARRGIRVADLLEGAEAELRAKLERILPEKNVLLTGLYGAPALDLEQILAQALEWGERLAPYVVAAEALVQDALRAGKRILIEAAQGCMLDLDYGTYPYVTSTSPTAAGACQGAGIGPTQVDRIIGVFKAYTTRVGAGPFPTELHDATGQLLRERGMEFGTTTGRPRRTGWFDAVAARYAAQLNGMTEIALTKLDVLDALDEIPICVGYRIDGREVAVPPARTDLLERVQPVYEVLQGWRTDTSQATSIEELPAAAARYIQRIEELVGIPVTMIGVGPARRQILWRTAGALA
ncbi:adenylosuccinate synthase [Thermomicrobiaceae bacterium CFH 74404]|uniref:Adenylosuccinate synthetase n=1 Tax=Thermalbibacter longus TaxID=2951981 RepID=A0AA41WA42_9BACT|nr:adenylosuccinate synthase [Thermalbibacter longus]MCM8748332.1 adenylosuccinate synthase [Thermalbibacter longus]